ncbi:MAG: adenylate cyclase [Deltaproteobacteria bacterium]|nr:adenylate cyclase [Deltaproteobacteria bacterium]
MSRLRILLEYLRVRWWRRFRSREALERWQDRRVRRLLPWVLRRSAFYRALYAGRELGSWGTLPTIDKARMLAGFDTLNTVGIGRAEAEALALRSEETRDFRAELRGVDVILSSGTSGQRGLALVSARERDLYVGTLLARVLPGSLRERHRVALFLRANSNVYRATGRGRLTFDYFDLFEPLEAHLARLQTLQPTLLVAPASVLRALAELQVDGKLALSPRRVFSVAEVLEPLDEAFIARAFAQRVHQLYQCTEGFLGVTCAEGTLHLNEDLVVVQKEWIDEASGRFVPILTDFVRTTQPLLRYRLDDVLIERRVPCPCGSVYTALERVEGRAGDVLLLEPAGETGRALVRLFPDVMARLLTRASGEILEYHVLQLSPTRLRVELRVFDEPRRAEVEAVVRAAVERVAQGLGARVPELEFARYEPRVGPRKLRRIERAFEEPARRDV